MEQVKNTPRDFLLYLLSSATLYYSAVWIITLWYQYINHWFPEPNQYAGADMGISTLMRVALASLIIVFPVYIGVTHFLNKDLERHPAKQEMSIRRWLIYITLFLSAVTIITDLVILVNNLLDGDFTARFLLKVLAVFLVAGMVFGYYFYELRSGSRRSVFRWISIGIVSVSVIGAFFIVGSPLTNRQLKYDQQRLSDLQSIQGQIVNYWQSKQILPATLAGLQDPLSYFIMPKDPATGSDYEYRLTDTRSFELCATFDLAGDLFGQEYATPVSAPIPAKDYLANAGNPISSNWQHPAGRACFTRTIDPDLYPPYTKK